MNKLCANITVSFLTRLYQKQITLRWILMRHMKRMGAVRRGWIRIIIIERITFFPKQQRLLKAQEEPSQPRYSSEKASFDSIQPDNLAEKCHRSSIHLRSQMDSNRSILSYDSANEQHQYDERLFRGNPRLLKISQMTKESSNSVTHICPRQHVLYPLAPKYYRLHHPIEANYDDEH